MIKRATPAPRQEVNYGTKMRRRQTPLSNRIPAVFIAVSAVTAFFVGSHLRSWFPHHNPVRTIDSAAIEIVPIGDQAAVIVVTPDRHTIILSPNFNVTTSNAIFRSLVSMRITAVDALVLTSVDRNTGDGIVAFAQETRLVGPVVTPYGDKDPIEWWTRTKHSTLSELQLHNIAAVTWTDSLPKLQSSMPDVQVSLTSPVRSPWEPPSLIAKVSYKHSSLTDLFGLTAEQVSGVTGESVGASRLLMLNGQNNNVSKELLSEIEPDTVVLTGAPLDTTDTTASKNVSAADAQLVVLHAGADVNLSLPASLEDPITLGNN